MLDSGATSSACFVAKINFLAALKNNRYGKLDIKYVTIFSNCRDTQFIVKIIKLGLCRRHITKDYTRHLYATQNYQIITLYLPFL